MTIRPAPDTMTYVTALLPVAQGVSVYAALKRQADVCCDGRSRGQVMADTLVERVTGRSAAGCAGRGQSGALRSGPGGSRRRWRGDRRLRPGALGDRPATDRRRGRRPGSLARLRRLYAKPSSGALVAMESRSRLFPKGLATFIGLRDQCCRTPYCDAPVRHRDHARPHRRGGPTSAANGLGKCEQCNYLKESQAGRSAPAPMTTACTPPNTSPRPGSTTTRPRPRRRAHRENHSATSRCGSTTDSPNWLPELRRTRQSPILPMITSHGSAPPVPSGQADWA